MPRPIPALDLDASDDDRPIGRFLSRREVLALFGASGAAAALAACAPGAGAGGTAGASAAAVASAGAVATATAVAVSGGIPSCVVVPELTEGPYYVDENLERADIRVDTATGKPIDGAALRLDWVVSQVDGAACNPIEGVIVDVWHCDGVGVYSDVNAQGSNTTGHDFLRGYQKTDPAGKASFTTIYPGWYQGRAVHVHFKIRTDPSAAVGFVATSQLFFDDAFSAKVFATGVYAAKGAPDTPNASDGIYGQSGGTTLLSVEPDGDGYKSTFEIAVQLT
jgi:protocatechuate 3,4-dioxygenase beta subunit